MAASAGTNCNSDLDAPVIRVSLANAVSGRIVELDIPPVLTVVELKRRVADAWRVEENLPRVAWPAVNILGDPVARDKLLAEPSSSTRRHAAAADHRVTIPLLEEDARLSEEGRWCASTPASDASVSRLSYCDEDNFYDHLSRSSTDGDSFSLPDEDFYGQDLLSPLESDSAQLDFSSLLGDIASTPLTAGSSAPLSIPLQFFVKIYERFESREELDVALLSLRNYELEQRTRPPSLHHLAALREKLAVEERYGPLSHWDVSGVSDLSNLFSSSLVGWASFDGDVSGWNVSTVEDMASMFQGCYRFNSSVGDWDVSSVRNFGFLFSGCVNFDQPLNDWAVGNGRNFSGMFCSCESFNQPLQSWDVRNGRNFSMMFDGCAAFNQPLAAWDVRSGVDFSMMFFECASFNQDLGPWRRNVENGGRQRRNDADEAIDVLGMFVKCRSFSPASVAALEAWALQVHSVAQLAEIFRGCEQLLQGARGRQRRTTMMPSHLPTWIWPCEAFACHDVVRSDLVHESWHKGVWDICVYEMRHERTSAGIPMEHQEEDTDSEVDVDHTSGEILEAEFVKLLREAYGWADVDGQGCWVHPVHANGVLNGRYNAGYEYDDYDVAPVQTGRKC
eukprot:g6915.t1